MHHTVAAVVLFILLAASVQGQSTKPCEPPAISPGSVESSIFDERQEVDLGDAISEHLQRDFRVIEDDEVTGHLNRIGQRIIKHLPPSALRYQFFLVDIPEANAFVLPGGRVYVSRKLIAMTLNEDELAGVIAHELGHLVARHGAAGLTRLLKEVLGVTSVGDRRDIYEKYNQLVENVARKPKAFSKDDSHNEDQMMADRIGLFALAAAGYDPLAYASFFDRLAETKGKTGNFFSDIFGATRPESKRLREIIKGSASLPPSCIEARKTAPADEYKGWQSAVINYTGLGRKESLRNVKAKVTLAPPLRGEINHIKFSPDGRYVLAQDDSGINVLSREPFAPLFRIEAAEARSAQFTPDSEQIVFHRSDLRVEAWSIAEQKMKAAKELFVRKGCYQTALSPDGKTLACLDSEMNLGLMEVATGAQVYQKKAFYDLNIFALLAHLLNLINLDDSIDAGADLINMGFSPDGRYFVASARNMMLNALGTISTESAAVAFDTTTRQQVSLRGALKKAISGGFTFAANDRLIGMDAGNQGKGAIVSFPAGEMMEQLPPLGIGKISAATRGNYLLVRPISKYPLGVMNLSNKTIFMANKQSAFDVYDDVFVSERVNGELGIYNVDKDSLVAKVVLPRNALGRLHAVALSPDLKWLAVSERSRGAVWNLAKGERTMHVRGFRGAHFSDDGALYADFPKLEPAARMIARINPEQREVAEGPVIAESRAKQEGGFVMFTKPRKENVYSRDVVIEMRESRGLALLWSKHFSKEAPQVWVNSDEATIVLSWPVSADAAKAEIKGDAALTQSLQAMKEKEGDYFLQVLDARTGKVTGRLLVETGKGSFRISNVFAAGDWLVIADTQNRVLVYSVSTGEQKGKAFGGRAVTSRAANLLCVENERGQLTIYDLASMDKRDQLTFSSPVSLARFSSDGKSLFVLTASQTAYLLDIAPVGK